MKKNNNAMRNMTIAAVLGGAGLAGYMYMKKNPQVMNNMKTMLKDAAVKKIEKL